MFNVSSILPVVTRVGAIIATTVMTFVVLPPVIASDENAGVNWKNIFVFVAGVLSIFLYDRLRNSGRLKKLVYLLLVTLVLLIVSYQIIYNQYTENCYDQLRVVTSNGPLKEDAIPKLNYWKKHSQRPIHDLLESNNCSSIEIWPLTSLAFPYYGLIAIYFAIIINVILLLVVLSDLVEPESQPKPEST